MRGLAPITSLKGKIIDLCWVTIIGENLGRLLLNGGSSLAALIFITFRAIPQPCFLRSNGPQAKKIPVVYEEHQTPDPQFNWWKGFEHSINMADRLLLSPKKARKACGMCVW